MGLILLKCRGCQTTKGFEGLSLCATQAQTHHSVENRSEPTQLNFQCVQAHVAVAHRLCKTYRIRLLCYCNVMVRQFFIVFVELSYCREVDNLRSFLGITCLT